MVLVSALTAYRSALPLNVTKFQMIEAVGVVSVVISLLIVAYEIRQTNKIAIVTAEIELRNNYSELNEFMATDHELAELLVRIADAEYQTSAAEHLRVRRFCFRNLNIWIASEIAFDNDMLPPSSFQIVLDDISHILRTAPYMHHYFMEILDNYPGWSKTKVVKAIDCLLYTSPSPRDED